MACISPGHERFDILIVDRMLPRLDGLTLIRSLREHQVSTLLLILSLASRRCHGASARSPARRNSWSGDLVLDLVARRVTRSDKRIELTAREFQLLEFLMRNAGQVVTRTIRGSEPGARTGRAPRERARYSGKRSGADAGRRGCAAALGHHRTRR
jgi:DNA-binding response OmpR family regulator